MKMRTSDREIKDLFKAWALISIAFGIVLSGGLGGLFNVSFFFMLLVSAISVGTGFVFHELAHKILAQKYGCHAEFRSFDNMLFLALVMSFFGFIIAAPGAVMISGYVSRERNGKLSLAGPLTNMIIALVFLIIFYTVSFGVINFIASYGFLINAWLGLFNLIPFGNFDGAKVLRWNKPVYFTALAMGIILVFFSSAIF